MSLSSHVDLIYRQTSIHAFMLSRTTTHNQKIQPYYEPNLSLWCTKLWCDHSRLLKCCLANISIILTNYDCFAV